MSRHPGLASSLFAAGVRLRQAAYDAGLMRTHQVAGLTVISVGNLRVGGSSKTPFALHLAQTLRDRGFPTALILRGYRGALERVGGLVSTGAGPIVGPDLAGDEAYLAACRVSGVSVYVGADRTSIATRARADGVRVAVLDDGFQHRRLYRDLDLVLVAPDDLSPTTALLPAGPLREMPSALERADLTAGLRDEWEPRTEWAPSVLFDIDATGLVSADGAVESTESLAGRRVAAFCGIARPQRFARSLERRGCELVSFSAFSDHHRYTKAQVAALAKGAAARGAQLVLTTEKDLVRLPNQNWPCALRALRIELRIVGGEERLDSALSAVLTLRESS